MECTEYFGVLAPPSIGEMYSQQQRIASRYWPSTKPYKWALCNQIEENSPFVKASPSRKRHICFHDAQRNYFR